MSYPTIFGREPAAVVGLIEAFLAALFSFGLLDAIGITSTESLGLVMAVVIAITGTYVAYVTQDTLLGHVITALKALVALGTVYGLSLTSEQSGILIALVTAAFSLFQRTQTSPTAWPSLTD